MKKSKIAFVIGSLSSGGAERVISSISNELIKKFDIIIITFVKKEPFYRLDENIKVIACQNQVKKPTNILSSLKLNYILLKRLIKILKTEKIDLAIGFITTANILTVIASKLNGIPSIISERNNPMIEDVPKLWVVLRGYIYPMANCVILQTEGVKKFFKNKINNKKIVILPNPIAKDLIENKVYSHKRDTKIILTVGRLDKNKCHNLLINAFKNIAPIDWKVIILGTGNNKKTLEKLIIKNNLSEKIEIHGSTNNISEYYNMAEIFVFTSRTEGFPNALLEAMYFGLPCISTNCDFGPSEIIDDGKNGYLIPIDNQELLETRLIELTNNYKLREKFSKNSRITANKYHPDTVINQWEKIISNNL